MKVLLFVIASLLSTIAQQAKPVCALTFDPQAVIDITQVQVCQ